MLNIAKDIDSLSHFKRKTAELARRLKKSGHPMVLTVNGKAELVVQDVESYQKMLEAIERLEILEGIQAGLEDIQAGRTRPAEEVHEMMRKRYDAPEPKNVKH